MAWIAVKPRKPKKPKKSGWSQIYGSPAPKKIVNKVPKPAPVQGVTWDTSLGKYGGFRGDGSINDPTASDYPAFPGFEDPSGSLLASLAASRNRDVASLRSQLEARTAAIAKLYADAGVPLKANYDQAIQAAGAVNDAVANRLGQEGAATHDDLLARLAQIGAPGGAVDASVNPVDAYYHGAAGANYAMDSGDVQRLVGRLAEEQANLAKAPGQIASQLQDEFASALSSLLSDYSSQEADLRGQSASAHADYTRAKYEDDLQRRQEKMQAIKDAADAKAAADDAAYQRYMAQKALASKNQQKAIDRAFKAQQAERDRQFKLQQAKLKYQASAQTAADKQTFQAEQAAIDREFKAQENAKNRAAAAKNTNAKAGVTPAQQRSAQAKIYKVIVRPDGMLKDIALAGDQAVINAINNNLWANGIDPASPAGKRIRANLLRSINGKRVFTGNRPKYKGRKVIYHSPGA